MHAIGESEYSDNYLTFKQVNFSKTLVTSADIAIDHQTKPADIATNLQATPVELITTSQDNSLTRHTLLFSSSCGNLLNHSFFQLPGTPVKKTASCQAADDRDDRRSCVRGKNVRRLQMQLARSNISSCMSFNRRLYATTSTPSTRTERTSYQTDAKKKCVKCFTPYKLRQWLTRR